MYSYYWIFLHIYKAFIQSYSKSIGLCTLIKFYSFLSFKFGQSKQLIFVNRNRDKSCINNIESFYEINENVEV